MSEAFHGCIVAYWRIIRNGRQLKSLFFTTKKQKVTKGKAFLCMFRELCGFCVVQGADGAMWELC